MKSVERLARCMVAVAAAAAVATVAGCASHQHHDAAHAPDLRAVPSGLAWTDYNGVAMPTGDAGPHQLADAATGYDHTPPGAALAAIDHTIRMTLAGQDSWTTVAASELAPGPGKDSFATHRLLYQVTSTANPATRPTVRGYTITSYSPDRATVLIYQSFPDNSIATVTTTVAWVAADWRLLLPDPSSSTPTVHSVGVMDAAVKLEAAK